MKILWIVLVLFGVYFLASAATEEGLLPSGHGTGRISEVIVGLGLVGYGIFRLWKSWQHPADSRASNPPPPPSFD
jgi:uncharacterized membrane protein